MMRMEGTGELIDGIMNPVRSKELRPADLRWGEKKERTEPKGREMNGEHVQCSRKQKARAAS